MKADWRRRARAFTLKALNRFFWLALALIFLGIFLKLTWELHDDEDMRSLDGAIMVWLAQFREPWLNAVAIDITALGSLSVSLLISILSCVLFLLIGDRPAAIHLALAGLGASVLTTTLKNFVGRVRPIEVEHLVEVTSFSFPSGHTLTAATVYTSLALLGIRHFDSLSSKLIVAGMGLVIAVLVAVSRMYLGVHYPSDVLSGMCMGVGWAFLLAYIFFSDRKLNRG